jgi:hypothetical protein
MFTRKKFGDRKEDCRFQRWHPAQSYTMFAAKKVSERNENCRFQPAYVRKAIDSGCNPGGCELQDEVR